MALSAIGGVVLAALLAAGQPCVTSLQELSSQEVVERLQAVYERTASWEAQFVEVSFNRSLGKEFEKRGTVYFQKPGLMRWDYKEPEKKLIISDGTNLWFYTPADKQVIKTPVEDLYRSRSPFLFLTGEEKLTDCFHISMVPAERASGGYVLELVPKEPMAQVSKLVFELNPESFQIVRAVVYDLFGNWADVRFSSIVTRSKLSSELFRFVPPPGVEVIVPSEMGQGG